MVNQMLEEAKAKKSHFSQNAKLITSIKKDLSKTHVATNVVKDPAKKVNLKNGIPITKSKISFMGRRG